jgi:hypothetical protein
MKPAVNETTQFPLSNSKLVAQKALDLFAEYLRSLVILLIAFDILFTLSVPPLQIGVVIQRGSNVLWKKVTGLGELACHVRS